MTELSPAAQAVLIAFGKYPLHGDHIAANLMHGALPAALRAVADSCHSQEIREADHTTRRWICLDDLITIADELEGGND